MHPNRPPLFRLCAAVLVGSMGLGVVSPALAADDVGEWFSDEEISGDALAAAMEVARDAGTPAEVAGALALLLGDDAPERFLHALYGQLLLSVQQGPLSVVTASAGAVSGKASPAVDGSLRPLRQTGLDLSRAAGDALVLPRSFSPAVQPLGP